MIDRKALTEQLFNYLETAPEMPDYLAEEPDTSESLEQPQFSPYQMVGEWIALRQEVKQQNKLMQSAQQNLQQTLQQNSQQVLSQVQTLEQTATTPIKQEDDSELVKDLLLVMDSLDNAIDHSNSQINSVTPISTQEKEIGFWDQLLSFFESDASYNMPERSGNELLETLTSHKAGIEMIRRSLLDSLKKRQVTPMNAMGQPFDATCMIAIAQQPSDTTPTNSIIKEVVRGYWKGDRILREAQVIVARREEAL
jgi:molecular chaperone GrpE